MEQAEKPEVVEILVSIPEAPRLEAIVVNGVKYSNIAYEEQGE